MITPIHKVLIANRGEIAIRVMRTCKDLGIPTVAVYSEADVVAPHVQYADEAVLIGPPPSSQSYLVMDKIIAAAKQTGANAIHPGYGFLSENSTFSKRCKAEGIIFIGPDPESIDMMGDKTKARELMEAAGVPLPPGTTTALVDIEEARMVASNIGYPVLVKAAAGGGGKGMRIIYDPADFESGIRSAKSEALNAFGDDRVYVEKYLEMPRHVEVQIMADRHGNVVHFYDRECSIQRRHQKVVEEAPCAFISDELRSKMTTAAVTAAKQCNYVGAGTVEFLIDKHLNYYFLEMNTRLQVEHPITELITGADLVKLQIMVAEGHPLPVKQDDIKIKGHAIECRVCAEDPAEQFLPSIGKLTRHRVPTGPGVRVDSGVEEGQEVSINYDPLLTKLCTWGSDRQQAIDRMKRALDEYHIEGCRTTIPFCYFVMGHPNFVEAHYDTHFIKDYFKGASDMDRLDEVGGPEVAALVAGLMHDAAGNRNSQQNGKVAAHAKVPAGGMSGWWMKRRS
jgi:acetyl-CoA carboxylase, biotin carboxylase subunit